MTSLPPGQRPRPDFPRFGLPAYATRFPERRDRSLGITLPDGRQLVLADALEALPRVGRLTDFHCVTTWSKLGLTWGGACFSAFFESRVAPLVAGDVPIKAVVLRSQDGYRTTMLLEDLMGEDVVLADELDGEALTIEHGAPLRLVAPAHYGYKSIKYLAKLEFCSNVPEIKHGLAAMMDHPRARVAQEERGRLFPGWLLRRVYRPLIAGTAERCRRSLLAHQPAPDPETGDEP